MSSLKNTAQPAQPTKYIFEKWQRNVWMYSATHESVPVGGDRKSRLQKNPIRLQGSLHYPLIKEEISLSVVIDSKYLVCLV